MSVYVLESGRTSQLFHSIQVSDAAVDKAVPGTAGIKPQLCLLC